MTDSLKPDNDQSRDRQECSPFGTAQDIADAIENLCDCDAYRANDPEWHDPELCPTRRLRALLASHCLLGRDLDSDLDSDPLPVLPTLHRGALVAADLAWVEQQSRDANEWQEHELWRNDCYAAGHSELEDCDEHGPTCCLRPHVVTRPGEQ